ncbi:MAG: hypothetical protein K0R94_1068 [Burkholderiales bacterium]|nr:hypothetical protein [Burkholderiales bacterium]
MIILIWFGAILNTANAAVGTDLTNIPVNLLSEIQKVCRNSYPTTQNGDIDWNQVISGLTTDRFDIECDEGTNSTIKVKSRFYYTEDYSAGLRNILGVLVPASKSDSMIFSGEVRLPLNIVTNYGIGGIVGNGFPEFMTDSSSWKAKTRSSVTFSSNGTLTTNSLIGNEENKVVSKSNNRELFVIETSSTYQADIFSEEFLVKPSKTIFNSIVSEYLVPNSSNNYTFDVRNVCKGECTRSINKFVYVRIKGQGSLNYVFGLSFINNIAGNDTGVISEKSKQTVSFVCLAKSQCSIVHGNNLKWADGTILRFDLKNYDTLLSMTLNEIKVY